MMKRGSAVVTVLIFLAFLGVCAILYFIFFTPANPVIIMDDSFPYREAIHFQVKAQKNFYLFASKDIKDYRIYREKDGGWEQVEIDRDNFIICSEVAYDTVAECLVPKARMRDEPELTSVSDASFYWEGLAVNGFRTYRCLKSGEQIEEQCALLGYIPPGKYRLDIDYYASRDLQTRKTLQKEFFIS